MVGRNIGGFDAAFRTFLFITSLLASILTGQWWWVVIGIIFFTSATFAFCPLYAIIGLNTHKNKIQSH